MKKYKQLNYEERVTIKIALWKKFSIRKIAKLLGISPSTISREIKRGITCQGTYFAESTERLVQQRKLNDKRKRKMDNILIQGYVLAKLIDKKSPHIIQHDIEKDNGNTGRTLTDWNGTRYYELLCPDCKEKSYKAYKKQY